MNENELVQIITKKVIDYINANPKKENITGLSDTVSLKETGRANQGTYANEVVVGLAPAFSVSQYETICGIPHRDVLREVAAGIEEEGLKCRFIKVFSTSDLSFIASAASKLSGSGIGIGIQSKGTAVIHQRDLYPLTNLELLPQAPLITREIYRMVGVNAARYAKGQSPKPIKVMNDCMSRPKYQAKAAILHIDETNHIIADRDPAELEITF